MIEYKSKCLNCNRVIYWSMENYGEDMIIVNNSGVKSSSYIIFATRIPEDAEGE